MLRFSIGFGIFWIVYYFVLNSAAAVFPPRRSRATPRPVLSKKKLDSQNRKIFFSFLKEKIARIQNPKSRENFSGFGTKIFSKKIFGGVAQRRRKLKIRIRIFFEKSSNFVQKVPQKFEIKIWGDCGLGASRRKVEIFQHFPSVFEIKIQSLLGNSEVRFAESENELKIHNQSFFLPFRASVKR